MAISVRFPDGSWREVPSELRPVDAVTTGARARFRHVPIGCDPQWRYVRFGSFWQAKPRHGALAMLIPPLECWWEGIGAMADASALSVAQVKSTRAA